MCVTCSTVSYSLKFLRLKILWMAWFGMVWHKYLANFLWISVNNTTTAWASPSGIESSKKLILNYLSGAGARINHAVILVALNYVCMYAVTLQECNYGFYACAHRHHNSCTGRPYGAMARPDKKWAWVKHEAQRPTRMREDARCKRGDNDAEREQRLSRMRLC